MTTRFTLRSGTTDVPQSRIHMTYCWIHERGTPVRWVNEHEHDYDSVYIPAGTRHCPLGFNRVDRPFRFSALSLSTEYASDEHLPRG